MGPNPEFSGLGFLYVWIQLGRFDSVLMEDAAAAAIGDTACA